MKDATGREVKDGNLVYLAVGSGRNISHQFAVVDSAATARVRKIHIVSDKVYDEPAGEKEWLNADGQWRKSHQENHRYEYVSRWGYTDPSPTTLRKHFSRAVIIDPAQVEDPLLKAFIEREGL